MTDPQAQDIKSTQIKIKLHIDELEEKVKHSRSYWTNCETESDHSFTQNLIEGHYKEIVHHIYQIRHHLEQISYHRQKLENINLHATTNHQEVGESVQNVQPNTTTEEEPPSEVGELQQPTCLKGAVARSEEDKLRVKNRRVSRSASLKYVLQWEKMLDEQKDENVLSSIKRRWKSGSNLTESDPDMSKIMVKNRVQQFEGFQKPKRASSTIETFLDFSGEKPRRVDSYPILEEEDECEGSETVACEHNAQIEEDINASDVKDRNTRLEGSEIGEKLTRDEYEERPLNEVDRLKKTEEIKDEANCTPQNIEETEERERNGNSLNENKSDRRKDNATAENCSSREKREEMPVQSNRDSGFKGIDNEESSTKPKIVGVQYKQRSPTDPLPEIPLL